jgi:hypothetical protein
VKYIGYLTALMAIVFGIEFSILKSCFPEYYFPLLVAIPLFFILFGSLAIHYVYLKPSPSINLLMGTKVLKMLISLALILLYVCFVKENSVCFLFSYLLYFLVYLVFETALLKKFNKKNYIKNDAQ